MTEYQAAIGRDVGKVDTDSGGLARYSLRLQVPPGVSSNAEPELSLEYCQGAPNGILGSGWALGGISCIRLAPSSLAFDGFNTPPADFDRRQPKYTLDGAELLNISGSYGAAGTSYTTEVEGVRRVITTLGSGFVVRESTGKRLEYGTTEDSRVRGAGGQDTREWRLKRLIDYHGNTVSYNYVSSVQNGDQNACYLSTIQYGANEKLGDEGKRLILFEYASRPDAVLQVIQGQKVMWASRLTAVRFAVRIDGQTKVGRAYEISYSTSQSTGDSLVSAVTETSPSPSGKISLLPSNFGYTTTGVPNQDMFKRIDMQPATLRPTVDNISLSVMNISGRCLADLACFRWNRGTKRFSVKTFLAAKDSAGRMSWNASDGPGAEETLPSINLDKEFPSILTPDMNGDGRADLIIPYADSNNNIVFSISQCIGTGFQKARTKVTSLKWTDGSRFMAMDLSGRGTVDIVQIFTDRQKLAFRNFSGVNTNGEIGLRDAKLTPTTFDNVGTIDWVQLNNARTGAKSLVRVFQQDVGLGRKQTKVTTFVLAGPDSASGFKELTTSIIGEPTRPPDPKYSVFACDLNGDGSQDIVLATAEYRGTQMVLTLKTYGGDGLGAFEPSGSVFTRIITAPAPLNVSEGQFHVTNMNGSNYASLAFVYAERSSKSYSCIFVDGKSDGSLGDAYLAPIAKDIPFKKVEVVSTDLDGTGMGDWLLYSIENDIPKLVPVYNTARITDFLAWTQDSMGLHTDLSYGCLSDQAVYTSAVDWKNYTNTLSDGYPVIAAPNYVVTGMDHRNESSVNAFDYKLSIRKKYARARINTLGRGWQGFEEINTTNVTAGILTTERYLQAWPKTGMKSEILTRGLDGAVASVTRSSYDTTVSVLGDWKIYRTNRTLEQKEMVEAGVAARVNTTRYGFDADGNMDLIFSAELQRGQLVHQSWRRSAYTTIDGVSNVLVCVKTSSSETNTNMSQFEVGDLTLIRYENDTSRAVLRSIAEWSTDVNSFTITQVAFNEHGKLVRSIDPAGLQRTITYDSMFHASAVKNVQQGSGVMTSELTAFDIASGLEIARRETNGLLSCFRVDGFGRTTEIRAKAASQGQATVKASDFLERESYTADASLLELLGACHLEPQSEISFVRTQIDSNAVQAMKIVSHYQEGLDGRHELIEYVDCLKQMRKRESRDASESSRVLTYFEYDSHSNLIYEGFPIKSPGPGRLTDRTCGIVTTVDLLNRPVLRVRPAHGDQSHFLITENKYLDGGARIQEVSMRGQDASGTPSTTSQLATIERRYVHIGDDDLLLEQIDESGVRSKFEYDAKGRLLRCIDGAGQIETRVYNTRGDITVTDNAYQNTAGRDGTVALRCQYDSSGHMVQSENAAGEVIKFTRDEKGRILTKIAADGRTISYAYLSDLDLVSSITIFPRGIQAEFESKFSFDYDHRGRISSRSLTLPNGRKYTTSVSYDWQDRERSKKHPDGTEILHAYRGLSVASSTLSGGSASTWSLVAEVVEQNAYGRPEKVSLSGSGIKEKFTHDWTYDRQGFPTSHALSAGSRILVKEDYLYNDLDQISRKHEFVTGSTVDYGYSGKRLASSQVGDSPRQLYVYDAAGNLKQRRGVSIDHTLGSVKGVQDSRSAFEVTYDQAGRVRRRQTEKSDLEFRYDGFGALQNIRSPANSLVEYLTDFSGEMFRRQQTDGSSDLFISNDYSLHVGADGQSTVRHALSTSFGEDMAGHLFGSVSTAYETEDSTRSLSAKRGISIHFTDTKGNVTHIYDGGSTELSEKLDYDDFGLVNEGSAHEPMDSTATYEGKYLEAAAGLINFKGRWYDPLVGRFLTPDNILDLSSLLRTDGLNRYAFENNDPINHVDPTGHWSLNAILGIIVSVVLVVAAVALTVATGGAATPLLGAVVGALASGGIAGIMYSVEHKDEERAGKFWGGFAATVALNAVIGAVGGAAGAASTARFASSFARIGIKAAIGGVSSVLSQAADRGVENAVYNKHHNLFEGSLETFLGGAVIGGVFGKLGDKSARAAALAAKGASSSASAASGALRPGASNSWLTKITSNLKSVGKAGLKPGGKLGWWQLKEFGVDKVLIGWGKEAANPLNYLGRKS